MKKIPTLFQRDPADRAHVLRDVTPGCEWALTGEGAATVKVDGTCTMLDADGRWWARREIKPGKTPPDGWTEVDADEATGKLVGWQPIEQSAFAKFHAEAVDRGEANGGFTPGTYELMGPKVNGNPSLLERHELVRHGADEIAVPSTYDGLREFLRERWVIDQMEGVVWWHPDGRRAKLKAKDFPPLEDRGQSSGG